MRALRGRVGGVDEGTAWEAFLLDVIRSTPMPDFLLYGEPYPALNGVVLSRAEDAALRRLTEQLAMIFAKAVAAVGRDEQALARLGFPWIAAELLAREDLAAPILVGRFDFLLDRAGCWQVLEYNADTPSGAREACVVEGLIAERLGVTLPGGGAHLAGALGRAFARSLPARAEGGTLGLFTDAGYAEDLAQTVFLSRLLAPALRGRAQVLVGDVDNLSFSRGRLRLIGRPLDALYRYYPFETLLGQQAFVDLFAAVASGRLRLLNNLRGLLAQNKGLLAWIWERREDAALFTAAERGVIQRHVPPVRWIADVPAAENGSALVLKQVFGREGEEVYFGERLSAADWERCRGWGSYVAQRRVEAAPVEAVVQTAHGPETQTLWPAVGSFAVAGRWAGYYTRLGGPITTARAKFVGTFIEEQSPSEGPAPGRPGGKDAAPGRSARRSTPPSRSQRAKRGATPVDPRAG